VETKAIGASDADFTRFAGLSCPSARKGCLPFNVARAYDEARGIDTPRVWTAERDRQVWEALRA